MPQAPNGQHYDVFQAQSTYHCTTCYQEGGAEPRVFLCYTVKGADAGHCWIVAFPCNLSRQEFLQTLLPFVREYILL